MLSKSKYELLTNLLSDGTVTFEDSLKRFTQHFTKSEYFHAGWIIQHMIKQNVYLPI